MKHLPSRALLFLLFLFSFSTSAQTGFYAKAGLAWQWAARSNAPLRFLSPPRLGGPANRWHDAWTDVAGGSYGTGQAAYLDVGYRASERWGFGAAARYVFSPQEQRYVKGYNFFGNPTETILTRTADNPIFLEPALQFYLDLGESVEAYFRFGAVVPLRHTITAETYTPDTTTTRLWQTAATVRTRFGVGGAAGAGIRARLGRGFSLFAQAGVALLSLKSKDEMVQAVVSSQGDVTGSLTTADRRVEYVNRVTDILATPPDQPSQRPQYLLPFSYWSVDIGVGWSVGN